MKDFFITISPIIVFVIAGIISWGWHKYSSGKKWESIMKPCPRCGHKSIIVWYNGENNPDFYMPECGAYMRRRAQEGNADLGEIHPENYFNDQFPMTEKQKKCSFLAGYCNDENENVPHFSTPRAAAVWWNRHAARLERKFSANHN